MFNKYKDKFHSWFLEKAEGDKARWWLGIVSFTESSVFPIPPDPLLMAVLMIRRECWIHYSLLVSISSVLGGVLGYLIGFFVFATVGAPIVEFYGLESELQKVTELYSNNAFLAVFTAAFTPIPYKIFTLTAGLFKVNFWVFLVASILGRSIRFFIVGYLMNVFGERIGKLVYKYFNVVSLLVVLIIVLYILFKVLV